LANGKKKNQYFHSENKPIEKKMKKNEKKIWINKRL
jgi:hypothetical protein